MTSWTQMKPVQFDATLVRSKRAREFVASAGSTMFPDVLPEPEPRRTAPAPEQLPGQSALFGEEETG